MNLKPSKTTNFAPPRPFNFDQKLTQNFAQIIFYYDVAK